MRKIHHVMLALLVLAGASSLQAQGATLNTAIGANFTMPFPTTALGTPILQSNVGDIRVGILAVRTALYAASITAQTITTTDTNGVLIRWGHDTGTQNNVNAGEIVVCTGMIGTASGGSSIPATAATATNNGALSSAYAVGGDGAVSNIAGAAATATVTTVDGVAEAYGGTGSGTGAGGAATANSQPNINVNVDVGRATAIGGDAGAGGAGGGNATAHADGNAFARGGIGTGGAAGGNALTTTSNGANVGATAISIGGLGGANQTEDATGPTSGQQLGTGPGTMVTAN